MNTAWTILNKGEISDGSIPFARKTDPFDVSFNVKNTVKSMVPETNNYIRYYYIERLVQVVRHSPLKDRLLELDPMNNYHWSQDYRYGITVDNNTGLQITYNSDKSSVDIPIVTYNIGLNVPEEKIKVSSEYGNTELDLNMTNNLSDQLSLSPCFNIKLQGDVSSEINGSVISITDNTRPVFDIKTVLDKAVTKRWQSEDTFSIYKNGTPVERLAAVIINTMEITLNG